MKNKILGGEKKMIMDKNEVKFEVIAFLVLFATLALTTVGCASAAQTHYVNPGESIQAAIGNAVAGDTIIVRDGTYTENVDVNVNHLTIKSEHGSDSTIVQAANTRDNVFAVTADYVNISGFTVKNATGSYKAGIYLGSSADHCNISYNNATHNYFGIELFFSSDNMLVNNIANSNNYTGIRLSYSSDNTLTNNTANSNNYCGIYLLRSSNYNTLTNNTANSNSNGIDLRSSNNNTFTCNTANSNIWGITLRDSENNELTNNTMSGNKYNIYIDGRYTHDIDTSNLVDGKPIYYWVNQQDQQVPNDAGFVGLVKSTNITVKDLTLTMNGKGMLLIDTTDSRIENVNASNNLDGIHLSSSSNNTLVNNTANSNSNDGVYLYASGRNTLTGNTANSNRGNGIYLYATPTKNNTLTNNTANSNLDCGIYLWFSGKNNTLANNTVNSNSDYGICLKSSSDNCIYNNYLNNRNNAYDEGNNTWNIAKTDGTNIIGGSWLGGNYWSDYTGEDSDGDGLGNTLLPYNSSGDIQNGGDYLPLVKPSAP